MTVTVHRAQPADVRSLFVIRTAVRENHMTLAELAAEGITPETVSAMLRNATAAAWVAHRNGRPIGFSMARAGMGDLFALFVRPEAEGYGAGTRLIAEAERWLASCGIREAWLVTGGETGIRAPGFYLSRGWQEAGRDAEGNIRFTKMLAAAV